MNSFWIILAAALPVYLMIGAGFVCRRTGVLTAEADRTLMRLTVNLLTPCLILHSLINNKLATEMRNLIAAPLIGFATAAAGVGLCYFVGLKMRLPNESARAFGFTNGICNYAYIPLPLVLALFGNEALGLLFLHNVGVELAMWTIGIAVISGAPAGQAWKHAFSPPVIAVVGGVLLAVSGVGPAFPSFITKTMQFLGGCAFPLGLLLTGAIVFDYWQEFEISRHWKEAGSGLLLRMAILPFGLLVAAMLLPISHELAQILVIQAAMPAAMAPIFLTKLYRGDVKVALRAVILSSLVSFVTIPPVIELGLRWIGFSHPTTQAVLPTPGRGG